MDRRQKQLFTVSHFADASKSSGMRGEYAERRGTNASVDNADSANGTRAVSKSGRTKKYGGLGFLHKRFVVAEKCS